MGLVKIPAYVGYGGDLSNRFSISSENEYIPIHAVNWGTGTLNGNRWVLTYGLPAERPQGITTGKYDLFKKIVTEVMIGGFPNTDFALLKREDKKYLGAYGMILGLDEDKAEIKPLMLLCIKARYLDVVYQRSSTTVLDDSYFSLLIDKSFWAEENRKLFDYMRKHWIDNIILGLEVNYVPSIDRLCFKSGIEEPKFRTIGEMMNHLNSINSLVAVRIINEEAERRRIREEENDRIMGRTRERGAGRTAGILQQIEEAHAPRVEIQREEPRVPQNSIEIVDDEEGDPNEPSDPILGHGDEELEPLELDVEVEEPSEFEADEVGLVQLGDDWVEVSTELATVYRFPEAVQPSPPPNITPEMLEIMQSVQLNEGEEWDI